MRKIAIAISKGGTGKTTTTINLAAALARAGRKVLVIDADSQGHTSVVLGVNADIGLAECIQGKAAFRDAIQPSRENIDVMPGSRRIAIAERHISSAEPQEIVYVLDTLFKDQGAEYDYWLFDCSPGWNVLTANIFYAVSEVLAPVSVEPLSANSLREFVDRIEATASRGAPAQLRYIVPTMLDRRVRKSEAVYKSIVKHFPDQVTRPIRYSSKLAESPARNETIFEYDPRSKGAIDYAHLAKRIIDDE